MPRCRHIRLSGHRCTTPALDRHDFCFYHRAHRLQAPDRAAGYPPSDLRIPALEDRAALQVTLHQVLDQLAAGTINPKRAGMLLYGLQIAASLLPRTPVAHTQNHTLAAPAPTTRTAVNESDDTLVPNPTEDPHHGLIAPKDPAPATTPCPIHRTAPPCHDWVPTPEPIDIQASVTPNHTPENNGTPLQSTLTKNRGEGGSWRPAASRSPPLVGPPLSASELKAVHCTM